MTIKTNLIRNYLTALESNQRDEILKHFVSSAQVTSPTYGKMEVEPFYTKLCDDTEKVTIQIRNVSECAENAALVYAYFDYTWMLKDGTTKILEILDVFEIDQGRIKSLRIFADGKKE